MKKKASTKHEVIFLLQLSAHHRIALTSLFRFPFQYAYKLKLKNPQQKQKTLPRRMSTINRGGGVAPPGVIGLRDPYTSVFGSLQPAEFKPPTPGEFEELSAKLPPDQKAELNKSVTLFKKYGEVLKKDRTLSSATDVTQHREVELENASKDILIALRGRSVGPKLYESLKVRLYQAYINAHEFLNAIDLYPYLKKQVGARLQGIAVLTASKKTKTGFRSSSSIVDDFYSKVPGITDELIEIFKPRQDGKILKPPPTISDVDLVFRLGCTLPIYYLLVTSVDFSKGICNGDPANLEKQLRSILSYAVDSNNFKPDLFRRICHFAGVTS